MEIEAFQIKPPSTAQIFILVAVLVVLGIAFLIIAMRSATGLRKKGRAVGPGWHAFSQVAKKRGFTRAEIDVMRRLVVNCGLTKPTLLFTSRHILDSCVQRAIRRIRVQDVKGEKKEDAINFYYRLRNKIARTAIVHGIPSTTDIPVGSRLRVSVDKYGEFTTTVNRNDDEYLGIGIPVLPPGKMIPWNRKKVKCTYWREDDAAYAFETKVKDVIVNDEVQTIALYHTDRISRVQKRMYPRKSVRLPVFFSRVRVVEEGGKRKAVVDRRDTHWGTIIDLSVGGLSIETAVPVDRNNYIRVEFELREDYKVVAFGKVKRIERNNLRKTWNMHIQFTKIEKKHRNEIFAVMYDYHII
ncbi:MAG: flagellar brake protein [Spirochaetota bacterium]